MQGILERFLRYAKINTRSNEDIADRTPTSDNQWQLARLLEGELKDLGLQDVHLNEQCFLTASLPATSAKKLPTIAFLAHMDTSPDFNAEGINPQIIEAYDGGDIPLKGNPGMALKPHEFPDLLNYRGNTLVTTDGSTLLGADDKAGLAAIMTSLEYMVSHPGFMHGPVKIAFTPDEETSYGINHFDVEGFGADFAYTIDGGKLGELEFENFNAGRAYVTMHGRSVHPGDAKGVLVNAMLVLFEFNGLLPVEQRPEYTEGREGFYHLWKMSEGNVERVQGIYLLRDHDAAKYDRQKETILACADFINKKYGANTAEVRIEELYRNMREQLEPVMHVVDTAREAMLELGITPVEHPIRGGTDGARLSFRGLPTPNIFNGGHNFHGPYEFLVVEHMQLASQVILKILELYEKK